MPQAAGAINMHDLATNRRRAADYFRDLQDRIVAALEELDGAGKFREDSWERPGGGGGRSRVLAEG
jgi:coproporphyrinogen III oxidase